MRKLPPARQDLREFPGGDLVVKGLEDLSNHCRSQEALLVLVAAPRLRGLGIAVAEELDIPLPYEHALYEAVENRIGSGSHSAYNALISRIVSFANAYSHVRVRELRARTVHEKLQAPS